MTSVFNASEFLKHLTTQPGVYRMYDADQALLYVGKAKNLKKRVSSYFRKQPGSVKIETLVRQIAHIDVTITHTEGEALLLENNYIKELNPKYNVLLRDDKSYPYIYLSKHRHPRVTIHRGSKKGKGEYFGPYPNAGAVWESLRLFQKVFPVRQCEDAYYKARTRPCLQYQLKRCSAPCVDKISDEEYQSQVDLLRQFLNGKDQQVLDELVQKMEQASMALEFEAAARYRDQLQAVRKVQEQHWVSGDIAELDAIGVFIESDQACVNLLSVRGQRVLGSQNYFMPLPKATAAGEVLDAFIKQHYLHEQHRGRIPSLIMTTDDADDALVELLSEVAEHKVNIQTPKRGEKARYLALAMTNAQTALKTRFMETSSVLKRLASLKVALEANEDIQRIECFDISHTMGQQTVASCVVFQQDGMRKSDYRRYNVVGITPGDDYAAMAFAMAKRYKTPETVEKLPQLILIDGGKGQLAQAEAFFADWPNPPLLVGVAKGVSRKPGLETLILAGNHRELHLEGHSPGLHLIQQIRDEAHRFAITGHRQRRAKASKQSTLEDIPGVGPKRRKALLQYMGGLQELKRAGVDEIAKVPGMSRQLAEKVHQALNSN